MVTRVCGPGGRYAVVARYGPGYVLDVMPSRRSPSATAPYPSLDESRFAARLDDQKPS